MDSTLRNVIKFVLAGMVGLALLAAAFSAGFGSAYLLTGRGVLPAWPASTSPGETEEQEEGFPPTSAPTPTNADEQDFQLFWEVWGLVQHNFYGELPDMQEVTYAAIHGMLLTLDDEYTAFMEPNVAAVIAEDATGEFEGIGAFVDMDEENKLEIVGTFEGGPAEGAGLLAGDRVLEVDGISVVGSTLYEAIGLIRGPAGTEITLLIEREDVPEPFQVTLTRARLEIPIIEVEMRDDGVGYIGLREFSATASERVEQGLEELLDQEPEGIILDLRQNPGGWLDQAVNVSDLFLDDGVIVVERWSDGGEQMFEADPGDVGEDVPLVVLVNGSSASASEIVAGALQDWERAVLIGEPTFGKGSVQRPFTLSDGSELRVTIALWFTPDDQVIHGHGLTPDIEVPWPEEEDLEPDMDPQLERAVEYLLVGE
ncbi:MAG: S41 family peptidase [Chloroflexota bacterium]|nr:S41 family peptidase [Chloroflexota bacterium]